MASRKVLTVIAALVAAGGFLISSTAEGRPSSNRSVSPSIGWHLVGWLPQPLQAKTVSHGTTTSTSALPEPPAGFVKGRITAIGDSVMVDYAGDLAADLPGVVIDAAVSRQFSAGVDLVRQLRASHQLGATVVIGLGTNGPISPSDLTAMFTALSGASRVVLVTVHVGQPWQGQVNNTLIRAAKTYSHTYIANWNKLGDQHPSWFYSDGTHLPIGGTGAKALAGLVAHVVKSG